MSTIIKNVLLNITVGGIWGVFCYFTYLTIFDMTNLIEYLFHFIFFSGLMFLITIQFDLDIDFRRLILVGLCGGITYNILSHHYPFVSVLILSLVITSGFRKAVFHSRNIIVRYIRSCLFILFGIAIVGVMEKYILNTYLYWFLTGSTMSLIFTFCILPYCKICNSIKNYGPGISTFDEIEYIKEQTSDIIKDLRFVSD